MKNPLISIVVPYYQWDGTAGVPKDRFNECIESLQNQTFKNFEVLIYHDGPIPDDSICEVCPYEIKPTEKRFNDFGHSLRDLGIRESRGEYILTLNSDNILYPNALQHIASLVDIKNSELFKKLKDDGVSSELLSRPPIIIFPIYLLGVLDLGFFRLPVVGRKGILDFSPNSEKYKQCLNDFKSILTGVPCVINNVDAMQVVVRRDVFMAENGWYDKTESSDGVIFPNLVKKYGCVVAGEVLGEHYP